MDVYITDVAAFLPNEPISNDDIEKCLGVVDHIPVKVKRVVLKSNNIKTRYYAVDPATGKQTHTNAQLSAEAVRRLKPYDGFKLDDVECLSCGTATPDQLMPGHGLMVHGELKSAPCEVVTTAGICISGMTAMKYAFMNVAMGFSSNAVATGSDMASPSLKAQFYKGVGKGKEDQEAMERGEAMPFDTAFLRWMLSDAAGAAFLTGKKPENAPALRIDWIENISFAGEYETCMYSGAHKNADGTITGWRQYPSFEAMDHDGVFLIKQDVKLLNREIMKVSGPKTLPYILKKHKITPDDVSWLLPHYSSGYFRQPYYDHLKSAGFEIPFEKWFTNVSYKGNTGSASIYVIMEELFHSGRINKGDRLLCYIPESGRFSMCYMMLTAV